MSPVAFARRTVAALCLALASAACHDATSPRSELESAARVWNRSKPPSYDVTLRLSCFCLDVGRVRVAVRDGAVVGRTVVATGQPLDPRFADQYPSVDGLFATIERALREGYAVTATYDRALGYPTEINASKNIPDAGYAYYVTSFGVAGNAVR